MTGRKSLDKGVGIPKTTLWHRLRKYPPNIAFNL